MNLSNLEEEKNAKAFFDMMKIIGPGTGEESARFLRPNVSYLT